MSTWSCPDAHQILRADAPDDAWHAQRRAGIGGSDASTVAGVNPYESLYTLWLDKTGRAPAQQYTSAMEWGHRLEPVIREWFTDTTGITVRRAGLMAAKTRPWQRVNVDGLTDDGGIAEWKTTSWRTSDAQVWLDGEVPDHAELQVQHGLAVTGRRHAHCVALIDGREPVHCVVERDDELITTIINMQRAFWDDHILADVAPGIDNSTATRDALKARYGEATGEAVPVDQDTASLVELLKRAKQKVKDAETEQRSVENRLRETFGTATDLVHQGNTVATLHQNGQFAEKKFAADHPDVHADYLTGSPTFDRERFKTEQPDLYGQYRSRVLRTPTPKPVKE